MAKKNLISKKDYITPRSFWIIILFVVGLIIGTYFFTTYMLTNSSAAKKGGYWSDYLNRKEIQMENKGLIKKQNSTNFFK